MHPNARLTPLGRALMICDVVHQGLTLRAAAAARSVSEKTARKWHRRAREEGLARRLYDHSCEPKRQPRRTAPVLERRIVELRHRRFTYAQIVMASGVSRATVSRVLRRHHLNRLAYLEPKPAIVRYERARPGELLHLDVKKLGCFVRPGVRGTGNRADRSEGAGVEAVHVAIDDHSRLGFACVKPAEKIPDVVAALHEAIAFYARHGLRIREVLTDNGVSYRSHAFAAACRALHLKHRFTRPYRPQTNGKAERFIQTLTREWAYGCCFKNSTERARYLPLYLHDYNWHHPHTALNQLPPVTRLRLSADNLLSLHS